MPNLRMKFGQYLWCWAVILLVFCTPSAKELSITGGWAYLYLGSISLAAIYLLLKFAGKSHLVFALSFFELLAILLQLASHYASLTKEVNWFYENYKDILVALFELEVLLLTIVGIYGFVLLAGVHCWRLFTGRDNSSHKSHVYPMLKERRQERR